MAVSRTCKAKQIISLLCVALFLDAACTFVGLSTRGAHASLPRSRVAVKSLTPPEIQLPFMDAPIPGATFALYCGGALVLVCLFGAYQLWRLFFSRELGTYAEIKWGGARPPKEYVDEMKKLEARRKRKFLRSVTDLWGVWVWCKHQRNQTQRDKRSNHEKSIACWFVKGKDPGPTTPFNIIQSYSIPSTWKGTMSFKIEGRGINEWSTDMGGWVVSRCR